MEWTLGVGWLDFRSAVHDNEVVDGQVFLFEMSIEVEALFQERLEHGFDFVIGNSGGRFGVDIVAIGINPGVWRIMRIVAFVARMWPSCRRG